MEKNILGVDPWSSKEIKIDEKLIKEFGLKKFDRNKPPFEHYFFNRGIIAAHRDFDIIEKCIKHKSPFIQLTGIASSGPPHLGHKVDIDVYLMFRKLGAKSFFVVSDIDAYVSRPDSKVPSLQKAKESASDIIAHLLALGIPKEEIYVQSRKEPRYYEFAFELSKKITENEFKAIYGHLNLGKISANLLQYADILHLQLKEYFGPTPTITAIGIEQDPHARACRDLARKLPYKWKLPSFVYFLHQSGLQEGRKMSASLPDTTIFLDDSPEEIKRKISNAFCPEGEANFNPVLDWVKHIIFRNEKSVLYIEREKKFGGDIDYASYQDAEMDFLTKKLHPMDLKNAVAENLIRFLEPARKYFELPKIKKMKEEMDSLLITR